MVTYTPYNDTDKDGVPDGYDGDFNGIGINLDPNDNDYPEVLELQERLAGRRELAAQKRAAYQEAAARLSAQDTQEAISPLLVPSNTFDPAPPKVDTSMPGQPGRMGSLPTFDYLVCKHAPFLDPENDPEGKYDQLRANVVRVREEIKEQLTTRGDISAQRKAEIICEIAKETGLALERGRVAEMPFLQKVGYVVAAPFANFGFDVWQAVTNLRVTQTQPETSDMTQSFTIVSDPHFGSRPMPLGMEDIFDIPGFHNAPRLDTRLAGDARVGSEILYLFLYHQQEHALHHIGNPIEDLGVLFSSDLSDQRELQFPKLLSPRFPDWCLARPTAVFHDHDIVEDNPDPRDPYQGIDESKFNGPDGPDNPYLGGVSAQRMAEIEQEQLEAMQLSPMATPGAGSWAERVDPMRDRRDIQAAMGR